MGYISQNAMPSVSSPSNRLRLIFRILFRILFESFFIILYFREIVKKKTCFSSQVVIKYKGNAKRKEFLA